MIQEEVYLYADDQEVEGSDFLKKLAAYGKDRNEDGDEQLFFSRKHLAQLGTKGGDHPCLHNQLKGAADDENKEDDLVYAGAAQSSHKSHGDFQR